MFVAVIFSGEAAAFFFSYSTSVIKAQTAANYIFWLRSLKPAVEEDSSKPPFDEDQSEKGPTHVAAENVAFSYETRPNEKVLDDISIDVSIGTTVHHSTYPLTTCQVRPGKFLAMVGASGCGKSTM